MDTKATEERSMTALASSTVAGLLFEAVPLPPVCDLQEVKELHRAKNKMEMYADLINVCFIILE